MPRFGFTPDGDGSQPAESPSHDSVVPTQDWNDNYPLHYVEDEE